MIRPQFIRALSREFFLDDLLDVNEKGKPHARHSIAKGDHGMVQCVAIGVGYRRELFRFLARIAKTTMLTGHHNGLKSSEGVLARFHTLWT